MRIYAERMNAKKYWKRLPPIINSALGTACGAGGAPAGACGKPAVAQRVFRTQVLCRETKTNGPAFL